MVYGGVHLISVRIFGHQDTYLVEGSVRTASEEAVQLIQEDELTPQTEVEFDAPSRGGGGTGPRSSGPYAGPSSRGGERYQYPRHRKRCSESRQAHAMMSTDHLEVLPEPSCAMEKGEWDPPGFAMQARQVMNVASRRPSD
jgi:hypothetical protein